MAVFEDNRGKWYVSFNYEDLNGICKHRTVRGFDSKRDTSEYEANFLKLNAVPPAQQR